MFNTATKISVYRNKIHPAKKNNNHYNKICKKINRIGHTLYEIRHFMCERRDRKQKGFRKDRKCTHITENYKNAHVVLCEKSHE
jgi:uncharacterized protein YdcH (DUF465 family)